MTDLTGKIVAIANRGEIAVRIAATVRRLGGRPVVLLSTADAQSYAARQIGRVEEIGPPGAEFDVAAIIDAAKKTGANFLHPGYGFLSERADLSRACEEAGIAFVGPSPATLEQCGDKVATRRAAASVGVPLLPASEPLGNDPDEWLSSADRIGYPLLVKPSGAGGGRGLRHVEDAGLLVEAVSASRRESAASGAGAVVYLERELRNARHIEVQVAAAQGESVAVGDRDCSLQRRSQKVIEEAPASGLTEDFRAAMHRHARAIAGAVRLQGIATCEFLLGDDGTLAFLEVNPRIQVEHPVTESVTGVDLVAWQLAIAAGEPLPLRETPPIRGHAIEARVYAEDPEVEFRPSIGELTAVSWPTYPTLRVDTGYAAEDRVTADYDAMLAKLIVWGPTRDEALTTLRLVLRESVIAGIATNLPWLAALADYPDLRCGKATTTLAVTVATPEPSRLIPLAGVAVSLLDRSAGAAPDPWSAIGPFRLSGETDVIVHERDWEDRYQLARRDQSWILTHEGTTYPLRWIRGADRIWTIALGDEVLKLAILERGEVREIAGAGGRWSVRLGARASTVDSQYQHAHDGQIRAPMPGKVLAVHTQVGDPVSRGAAVVTLSAMKMEIRCDAQSDGTVEAVRCAVGDLVDADQVLAVVRSVAEPET